MRGIDTCLSLFLAGSCENQPSLSFLITWRGVCIDAEGCNLLTSRSVQTKNCKCLEPGPLRLLSQSAFQYLLSKAKQDSSISSEGGSGNPALSLGEYLRFRQVILWCSCQFLAEPEEAEKIIRPYLPDVKASLLLLKERPQEVLEFESPVLTKDLGNCKASDEQFDQFLELKNSISMSSYVATLLSMIDLRRIHPELLIRVIEPLAIITPTQVIAALRFHALQRPRMAKGSWEDAAHASFYRIREDRSVIEKCDWDWICQGFQCHLSALRCLCVGYRHRGALQRVLQVGHLHAFWKINGASLAQQPSGWALRMDERGTHINKLNVLGSPWMPYGKKFGYKGARVRVQLDMFQHACFFSIDGQEFGEAWTNLPEGTYYPAVCLGSGALGRVRIELVSGFDLL